MTTKTSTSVADYKRFSKVWTSSQAEPKWSLSQSLHLVGANTVTFGPNPPNFRDRIRKGLLAGSTLDGTRHSFDLAEDGYIYFHKYLRSLNVHRYFMLHGVIPRLELFDNIDDPSSFIITSVRNRAIQQFNAQVRSSTKSLQGLVSLGELGDTVRMVNRSGRALFRRTEVYLRELANLPRHLTPQNIARTVSEKWLEYVFGVKPLVNDIGDFIDACYNSRYGRPPRFPIRGSAFSTEKTPPVSHSQGLSECTIKSISFQEKSYGYRLYGAVGLTDNNVPPFSREFGLTLDEFIPTVWELIPYSFLVDYASNVGAVIDAYSLNKSTILWLMEGSIRETKKTLATLAVVPDQDTGWVTLDSVIRPGAPLTRRIRKVYRGFASLSSTIPSLEFRIPGSDTQWLNIGALGYLHATASRALRRRSNA